MTQLSRERLEYYANNEPPFGYTGSDIQEMARRLLAAEAQEPVAWWNATRAIVTVDFHTLGFGFEPDAWAPLYAAPQPVAVPDEIQKLKDGRGFKYVKDGVHYSVNYANGWNACRAALNQTHVKQPSGPALQLPQWIPCSERMPLTPDAECEYSDVEVQVFDGKRVFIAHYAVGSNPSPWGNWTDTFADITHWQPLAAAPQEPTK